MKAPVSVVGQADAAELGALVTATAASVALIELVHSRNCTDSAVVASEHVGIAVVERGRFRSECSVCRFSYSIIG